MMKIKTIHYVWLGGEKNDKVKKCIRSWKKYLPDYKTQEWNESNISDVEFVSNAIKEKNYAKVSDYVRIWALKDRGGVYFDTDIEIVSNELYNILETRNSNQTILGIESYNPFVINNAVIIACKNCGLMNSIFDQFDRFSGKELANESGPLLLTKVYNQHLYSHVKLLPPYMFFSHKWDEYNTSIHPKAILLHYGEASWIENIPIKFDVDKRLDDRKKYLILRKMIYDIEQGSLKYILLLTINLLKRKLKI